MRILWSLPVRGERLLAPRGDLVRAARLIGALRSEGNELIVVESAARAGARAAVRWYRTFLRPLLPGKIGYIARDLGRLAYGVSHGMHVARVAREHRVEIIIETQVGFSVSGAVAARITSLPLVLDDCSPAREEMELGTCLPSLARAVYRCQSRAASALAVVSPEASEALAAEGMPPDKLLLVPNAVEPSAFDPARRDTVRRELGAGGACVVGYLGSFQPWHNVELLTEAAARLEKRRRGTELLFVLAGDGVCRGPTLSAAARLSASRIDVRGAIPPSEVPDLLGAFDVGVLPGTNDYGQPMKLLEYAAAGLPAVAPDVSTVREVIEPGVTGVLFQPGDADSLANAILALAREPDIRRRMGRVARERLLAKGFTWTRSARTLLAGIREKADCRFRQDSGCDFSDAQAKRTL